MSASHASKSDGSNQVAIRAVGIVKNFGHIEALRGADLELRSGEVLALVGDNGAGKSTLAKVICGAHPKDGGQLYFWDEQVDIQSIHHAHELGVYTVYQDLSLAPDLSIADNLFLGREVLRPGVWGRLGVLDRSQMRDEAQEALAVLGIGLKSMAVRTSALSGGERQALAVARAVNWATTALLMDEPTASLGTKQSAIVYETMRAAAERGLAVLVISHDIPRMLDVADRIAVMRHGVIIETLLAHKTDLQQVISLMLGGRSGTNGN
jgi:simple sugar transport system ATP-binding protein